MWRTSYASVWLLPGKENKENKVRKLLKEIFSDRQTGRQTNIQRYIQTYRDTDRQSKILG